VNFKNAGVPCLGIEPARNIAKIAQEKGIETLVDFLGEELEGWRRTDTRRSRPGNNVFAHFEHERFVAGLRRALKPRAGFLEFLRGRFHQG
jgi:hypothetical protein